MTKAFDLAKQVKYLFKNKYLYAYINTVDRFFPYQGLKALRGKKEDKFRLLLSFGGHLGDGICVLRNIALVQLNYPDIKICLLGPSWCKQILELGPSLTYIELDHWSLSRAKEVVVIKIFRNIFQWISAVRSLRKLALDCAVELYPYYGNNILALAAARIRTRVGYGTGGFSGFLTDRIPWMAERGSMADYQRDLIEYLLGQFSGSWSDTLVKREWLAADWDILTTKYKWLVGEKLIIVQPGSGNQKKEWPLAKWKLLLEQKGRNIIILTGKGERERINNEILCAGMPTVKNLTDQLSLRELLAIMSHCAEIFCVDSLAAHLGTFVGTQVHILYSGITDIKLWKPPGGTAFAHTYSLPCNPCLHSQGCSSMECIVKADFNL